jgi:hypothetical protein
MKTLPVSPGKLFCLSLAILMLPLLAAAKKKNPGSYSAARNSERRMVAIEAADMYDQMLLKDSGLNENALLYALLGYHRLLRKHALKKTDVLSVCDFSQSSASKRMYVIDLRNRRLLYRTYVAHGMGSGRDYANSFSNTPESYKSSLGFFVTRNAYIGYTTRPGDICPRPGCSTVSKTEEMVVPS